MIVSPISDKLWSVFLDAEEQTTLAITADRRGMSISGVIAQLLTTEIKHIEDEERGST